MMENWLYLVCEKIKYNQPHHCFNDPPIFLALRAGQ
jgi:hypothetical protein